ncbi:MAG: acetyl-CoA carboxylase biotin carboxyl carrier protein [Planctomycetaceae bacterium]|jgi:acetyl-CoA carboxylase biotin carboxyl carrier protein|nr:acetyl-CoA carboxylase biotin carboxyl carrier protein [Planctomycetaceae bacterium]
MTNNSETKCPNAFDIEQIEKLIDLMKLNDLAEIVLQQADVSIQLKRNLPQINSLVPPQIIHQAAPVKHEPAESKEKEINNANSQIIKSPMVGTFYAAINPEAPPMVKVGDIVTPDKTVCLIEAMKVYNEIQAECSGKIDAILVQNGEAVEYGKPLFRIITE